MPLLAPTLAVQPIRGIDVAGRVVKRIQPEKIGQSGSIAGAGHDHTLITPGESVGVMALDRPFYIHIQSDSYDWIGLARMRRNGFDSR
jgi:hypothetical protein